MLKFFLARRDFQGNLLSKVFSSSSSRSCLFPFLRWRWFSAEAASEMSLVCPNSFFFAAEDTTSKYFTDVVAAAAVAVVVAVAAVVVVIVDHRVSVCP